MNIDTPDDQECKLEEGVMEESSSRRIYHRRRRRYVDESIPKIMQSKDESKYEESTDESKDESKYESKDESKYESKEEDAEESYRDTPRNNNNTSVSPLLRSSRPVRHSSPFSISSIDNNDTKPSPMLTSSSSNSYTLRNPEQKLKERFSHRLRRAVDDIPEVHFIGEIREGIGFKGTYVSCKW